jgi:predicted nucleic acid-binding protein
LKLFCDTSALAKRYIEEPGSQQVAEYCRQASQLAISVICLSEMISALNRLKQNQKLSAGEYKKIKTQFFQDTKDMYICELSPEVIELSINLLEKNKLRALDSLHIASALAWEADYFLTADHRQSRAAQNTNLQLKKLPE